MTGRCFICGDSFDLAAADGTGKCPRCVGEAAKKADSLDGLLTPSILEGNLLGGLSGIIDERHFPKPEFMGVDPAAPGEDRTVKQVIGFPTCAICKATIVGTRFVYRNAEGKWCHSSCASTPAPHIQENTLHGADPGRIYHGDRVRCSSAIVGDHWCTTDPEKVNCPECRRLLDAASKDPVRENRLCRLEISDRMWQQGGLDKLENLKAYFGLPKDAVVAHCTTGLFGRRLHIASMTFPVVPEGMRFPTFEEINAGCEIAPAAAVPNHGPCAHCGMDVIHAHPLWTVTAKKPGVTPLHDECRAAFEATDEQPPLALQVEKLSPKAGDMIVVRHIASEAARAKRAAEAMLTRFPGVYFVVVPEGLTITNGGQFYGLDSITSTASSAWPDSVTMADLKRTKELLDAIPKPTVHVLNQPAK